MATAPDLDFNDLLDKEDVDAIFSLEQEIASGSFGTVYKVSGKTSCCRFVFVSF